MKIWLLIFVPQIEKYVLLVYFWLIPNQDLHFFQNEIGECPEFVRVTPATMLCTVWLLYYITLNCSRIYFCKNDKAKLLQTRCRYCTFESSTLHDYHICYSCKGFRCHLVAVSAFKPLLYSDATTVFLLTEPPAAVRQEISGTGCVIIRSSS